MARATATASAFLTLQGLVIPKWYKPLLYRARAHVASKQAPLLQLATKFDDDSGELKANKEEPGATSGSSV